MLLIVVCGCTVFEGISHILELVCPTCITEYGTWLSPPTWQAGLTEEARVWKSEKHSVKWKFDQVNPVGRRGRVNSVS